MQYKASTGRINKPHSIPLQCYHSDDDGKLKCDGYCVISDHLLSTAWSDCSSLLYFISNTNNSHKKLQNQQD